MRALRSAVALACFAAAFFTGCSKSELSSADKQRLNRALTYFLYAQANRQLVNIPPRLLSPRNGDRSARIWVVNGLKQPEQIVTHSRIEGHAGFEVGIPLKIGASAGGALERWYAEAYGVTVQSGVAAGEMDAAAALASIGLGPSARAEELTPPQFITLAGALA